MLTPDCAQWNHGTNAQQIFSLLALFTCLEALLGVINACLPVLKPIFNKFGDSSASAWISSVMSGTVPIFMRRSQLGSKWTNPPSATATKKEPGTAKETVREMPRWHGVSSKAADMMFPSPAMNVKSSTSLNSPIQTRGPLRSPNIPRGPPVPPKEDDYLASPTENWDRGKPAKGIRVQRMWDVESGISEESDRRPLDPWKGDRSRW